MVALGFSTAGARVVICGRNKERGASVLAELRELGTDAWFVAADLTIEEQAHELVDRAVALLGGAGHPNQ